jgi:hypothetical protein
MEMQRGILGRNDLSIKGQRQPILRKKKCLHFLFKISSEKAKNYERS